jgi:hypothetical protein
MHKIRDNKPMRREIAKLGKARNATDSVAEVTILALLFAYVADAARSVFLKDAGKGKAGYALKAGDFDSAMFAILTGPGVGKSLVRFACQTMRDIVAGRGTTLQAYVVKNAKRTKAGVAVFTVGRINPLWGQFTKRDGSDVLRVKGKTLELLIPATDGKVKTWKNWDSVTNAEIELHYSSKGKARVETPKTAAETVAAVMGKTGPIARALKLLGGKRSKRAMKLSKALAAIVKEFGADSEADKTARKSARAMKTSAKKLDKARKVGEGRKPEEARINNDAETVATNAK